MLNFMRDGGVAMWIILLFGGMTLISAILFMWRPEEKKLGFIRACTWATVFSILAGIAAGFGAVMRYVSQPEVTEVSRIVFTGLAEVSANPILGFVLLALAWMITALGIRRMP